MLTTPVCQMCDASCSSCSAPGNASACTACPVGNGLFNNTCPACSIGTYGAGGTTACAACAPGFVDMDMDPATPCVMCNGMTQYQNQSGQVSCMNVTQCLAGSQQSQSPTSSSDRICLLCPQGQFTNGPEQTCHNLTQCSPGSYISVNGTLSSDNMCSTCDATMGFYQNLPGQYACNILTNCYAGQAQKTAPTSSSDRLCANCLSGTFTTEPNALMCTQWTICGPGYTLLRPGSSTTDNYCGPCGYGTFKNYTGNGICYNVTSDCIAGQYQVAGPTATSDRNCAICNNALGFYQNVPGQTFCKMLTVCQIGQQDSVPPTPSSDRQCGPCPPGYYQDQVNQPACKLNVVCTADKQIYNPPSNMATLTMKTLCICITGKTYQPGQYNSSLPCLNVTQCTSSQVLFTPATISSDNVCAQTTLIGTVVTFFSVSVKAVFLDGGYSFSQNVTQGVYELLGLPPKSPLLSVTVTLTSVSSGNITGVYANVTISNNTYLHTINAGIQAKTFEVAYLAAMVSGQVASCPQGYVSPTGLIPCTICPANTFAAPDSAACFSCGLGQVSPQGSYSASQCTGKTTPSSSFASAVSKTPIIVGVVVAGTALILALLALFVYRTKRTQRHNLKFVRNKGAKPVAAMTNPVFKSQASTMVMQLESFPRQASGVEGGAYVDSEAMEPDISDL